VANDDSPPRRILVGVDRSLSARVALEHAARRTGAAGCLIVAYVMTQLSDAIARAISELDEERHAAARELVDRLAAEAASRRRPGSSTAPPPSHWPRWRGKPTRRRSSSALAARVASPPRWGASPTRCSHTPTVPSSWCRRPPPTTRAMGTSMVAARSSWATTDHRRLARRSRTPWDGPQAAVESWSCTRSTRHPSGWGAPYSQRALDAYQAHGRALLRSLEERDMGVELATSLLEGAPARAIVAAADARDADEIVVGSRGFGRLRGVLGSVSHAILHETDCPVVVIPADAVPGEQS
jgi:nucleotide-binding universal stress UspA family protein